MQDQTYRIIVELLAPTEKLLWTGRPKHGFVLRARDWPFYALGVIYFTIFLTWLLVLGDVFLFDAVFVLGCLFFLWLGSAFLFNRIQFDLLRRRNTYYGLTDKRIIIVCTCSEVGVESSSLIELEKILLKEKRDGSGTISFPTNDESWQILRDIVSINDPPRRWWWPRGFEYIAHDAGPTRFELIERARDVYDMILSAQRKLLNSINPDENRLRCLACGAPRSNRTGVCPTCGMSTPGVTPTRSPKAAFPVGGLLVVIMFILILLFAVIHVSLNWDKGRQKMSKMNQSHVHRVI